MAPAAFSTSSSGGSSPPTSPSTSTRSVVFADEAGDLNFGAGRSGNAQNEPHYGGATPTSRSRQQAPIAVVGMSCRLPGGASSPAEFWELCSRARSGFSAGAPKDRFNHEAFYDPNPGKTGTYHSQGGYFLNENITAFDAPFFSLTEKEAIASKSNLSEPMSKVAFAPQSIRSRLTFLPRSGSSAEAITGVHIRSTGELWNT